MYMPEYYAEHDKEFKKRVADYFDPWDLIQYLGITSEDIIEAFEAEVFEAQEDIEELMGISHE
jgi:hypothetical protein